ncbi:sulfatase family protein [Bremerella sp. P1]|uniref:sulfatase family protein n=1 Tax=Bremerella sp. P1 TaxID=3026424 RepID=UPI0023677137|nr:sulfatase [Bremerella sp. P1]WDI42636.1 sulfatase [Bremerella sp. P1]
MNSLCYRQVGDLRPSVVTLLRAVMVVAVGALAAANVNAEAPRPNILLILGDNWAYPHASICGDPVVATPTFDRLAHEGALGNNVFCQVPSCSPARAVLLSGQATHRLGEAANLWGNWASGLETYPDLLASAGYVVGFEGKGWAPGVYQASSTNAALDNPAGMKFKTFGSFLDSVPDGKPFCFWFGSRDPHQPWGAKQEFRAGLDASKVKVPEYLPDVPEVRETILDYYAEVQSLDHDASQLLKELDERGLGENTLVVMMGDNGWQTPRGLANVYDAGTRTPMAIRWPKVIKPGLVLDQFISFEDFAPTFLEVAGVSVPSDMTGKSLVPLLKGNEVNDWRDAIFLERERHANVRAEDESYPCRAIRTKDYLYVWNIEPELWPAGDPKMHFAVGPYGDIDNTPYKAFLLEHQETPEYRPFFELAMGKRPAEELYDLRTDPDQVRNIAAEPANAGVVSKLRQRVQKWMEATDDPRAKNTRDRRFTKYPYFGGPPRNRPGPK